MIEWYLAVALAWIACSCGCVMGMIFGFTVSLDDWNKDYDE